MKLRNICLTCTLLIVSFSLFSCSSSSIKKKEKDTSRLFPVIKDGKYGYINSTGNLVINPQFEEAYNFTDGLACAKLADKYGYIDTTGKYVINPQFSRATESGFSEGLTAVELTRDRKWGYIDKTGKIVINPDFALAENFSEGLAVVSTLSNGLKCGYIDKTGKIVIEAKLELCQIFSEGLAMVAYPPTASSQPKYGFIDTTGNMVISPQFYNHSTSSLSQRS